MGMFLSCVACGLSTVGLINTAEGNYRQSSLFWTLTAMVLWIRLTLTHFGYCQ